MSGFSIPLDRLATKYKAKLDTVTRKATLDLFRLVINKSPVDTGRFRANWNVSVGKPDYSTSDITAPRKAEFEITKVDRLPTDNVVLLSNGLPYARRLEYGYSSQAPGGMIRISVMEYKALIDRAIRSS
jgi:hypothetical protein